MILTENIQPLLDKHFVAALVAGMLIANVAGAAERDHLLPERSVIGDSADLQSTDGMLHTLFAEAYAHDVKFRMIDLPSFRTESVTALKEVKGGYQVFTLEPAQPLWGHETLPADMKMNRCEIEVDSARAQRFLSASKAVLLETKYTQPDEEDVVVTDGVEDHFSMPNGFQPLAGWTNYAQKGGKVAALYDATAAMFDYCAKRNAPALKTLDMRVGELETRMGLNKQVEKAPPK